jgi:hypothetical protein
MKKSASEIQLDGHKAHILATALVSCPWGPLSQNRGHSGRRQDMPTKADLASVEDKQRRRSREGSEMRMTETSDRTLAAK